MAVYLCYCLSLIVCLTCVFLFWMAIRPFCGKVTVLLAFLCLGFHYCLVDSCLCFFPFGVFDGWCKLIVSIPDLCFTSCLS